MSPWPWGGASGGGGGDGVDGRADHFGRSAGGEGWAVPPGRVWGGGGAAGGAVSPGPGGWGGAGGGRAAAGGARGVSPERSGAEAGADTRPLFCSTQAISVSQPFCIQRMTS